MLFGRVIAAAIVIGLSCHHGPLVGAFSKLIEEARYARATSIVPVHRYVLPQRLEPVRPTGVCAAQDVERSEQCRVVK